MKKNLCFLVTTITILHVFTAQTFSQSGYLLPDGSKFNDWKDNTDYTKTYYVSANHPDASDSNPGTFEKPFKSINKAAQVVKSAEKVVVFSGIYREQIQPRFSGESPEEMVMYEAAPGANVIVSGSLPFDGRWEPSVAVLGFNYARDIWQAPLDNEIYTPFYTVNANEQEMKLMPWAEKWTNKVPYTLKRSLAFQDGRRMMQLANYEDLLKMEGTYWVDDVHQLLHVHPFENKDPHECTFELTRFQQLFVPQSTEINYLHVKGFTFEHAGNGFPRVGTGALFVNGGHHWIIEENIIRQVNSVAIEAGARVKEKGVSSKKENAVAEAHPGGFIIRNNVVHDCGTGGIQGHTVRNTLIEHNLIHHIGWQHAEQYWECAAVKVLVNKNTVVAHNIIHDVNEASGIWLDWNNHNSRVTGNLLYNIGRTSNGAVFIEASIVANMVDNNIIWGTKGPGISLYDTDETTVCYNLIAFTEIPLSSRVNTNRSLNGVPLTSKNNLISYNIFYHNRELPVIQDPENSSDHNVFVGSDINEWQKSGFDNKSKSLEMTISFDAHSQILMIKNEIPLPEVTNSLPCTVDFWGMERFTEKTVPAPWQMNMKGLSTLRLTK